jgi:methyltransferase (TIGR00027 family)
VAALVGLGRLAPVRQVLANVVERRAPGIWGSVVCRKRYIDEQAVAAIGAGAGAVVNLGAGLDTRACRLPALAAVPVFEVDLPENIDLKRARLGRLPPGQAAHVRLVPLDFERQDLGAALAAAGYAGEHPACFIWEAVTQYLAEAGVRATLRTLAQARPGSRLAFTYVQQDFIDGAARYGLEALYQGMVVKYKLWHFGLAPRAVGPLLAEYGWREVEQLGGAEFVARYVRPAGRALAVSEVERTVLAEKV